MSSERPVEQTASAERGGPQQESYDAVVVGSGLGGISAGAFLAKAGKHVLVVERLDGPGGYAHSFQRGPYLFDPAVHAVGQGKPGAMLDTWLRVLGVRDRLTLIPLDPFYTVVLPGFRLTVPFGVEEFVATHVRQFPQEEAGIRAFVRLCEQVKNEWEQMRPGSSLEELGRAAANFATVLKYRTATVAEVMDEFLKDDRVKAVLGTLWGYQGTTPDRLSFITYAGMVISLLEGGQNYCKGSFQNLVNAFVAALEENGGELVVRQKVTRIMVEDGHVTGVTLADGRQIRAPLVISNADATQTFEELVGVEQLPETYLRRMKRMSIAWSAFLVYSATTLDFNQFDIAHEVFLYKHWDYKELYQRIQQGEVAAMAFTMPTREDPDLAPAGEHLVTAVALMPYDIGKPWAEVKDRYVEQILDEIEAVFPGYRAGLTFVEGATPLAMERYSLNRQGAMYGWENTAFQSHSRRPGNRTPIEGLYLTGAWAQPGSGTVNVMQSGFQTALIALGYTDQDEFLRSLGYNGATST